MTKPTGRQPSLVPSNGVVSSPQIQLTHPDGSHELVSGPRQRTRSVRVSTAAPPCPLAASKELGGREDLTVCDITGDWGLYQWSLCLFATCYSALSAFVVMFGPIVTPDMAHICQTDSLDQTTSGNSSELGSDSPASLNIPADRHECFVGATGSPLSPNGDSLIMDDAQQLIAVKCTSFLYNQLGHGLMLTNGFDLVCDRRWLRSLVSTAALAGMLISSITLGLFSDKFGRLRCIQVSFVISCLANVVCLVARDYFLFCACIALMSFAQIGAANALCTLMMEATSPRFRYVPVFEYIAGWSLGAMVLPLINDLTLDYRLFMAVVLAWQLLMLPWLHWGVFESIRWLLSEGHLNRAQIELRRACRMNNVQADTELAQSIARIEAQQVRKASRIIEHELAPVRLSQALGAKVDETTRELDLLSTAIRKSFFGESESNVDAELDHDRMRASKSLGDVSSGQKEFQSDAISLRSNRGASIISLGVRDDGQPAGAPIHFLNPIESLSPTLTRMSFSLPAPGLTTVTGDEQQSQANGNNNNNNNSNYNNNLSNGRLSIKDNSSLPQLVVEPEDRKSSLTTQGLIQLAMKYSKTVEREDSGQCFIVQMFHRKLWKQTLVLLLVSVMFETSYYGFMMANKFVGTSINLNYVTGALSDLAAAFFSLFLMVFASRKCSLISCTLVGTLICLSMALSYQLVPDRPHESSVNLTDFTNQNLNQQQQPPATNGTAAATTKPVQSLIDNDANLSPISTLSLLQDEPRPSVKSFATLVSHKVTQTSEMLVETNLANETQPGGQGFWGFLQTVATLLKDVDLIALRHSINFYLMIVGKFIISSGISIVDTITMETYPNNLRQTGFGAIAFVGRVGSILAPFLFADTGPEKHMFQVTLVVLGSIGLLVCCLVPVTIRDRKDKDLCDQMNEIE